MIPSRRHMHQQSRAATGVAQSVSIQDELNKHLSRARPVSEI